jgi:acyl-CoA reductase-like NAD-dependent aldehyde dehydrogenase
MASPNSRPLIELLRARVGRLKVGAGKDEGSFVGPLHSAQQLAHTLGLVKDAVTKGATLVTGGHRMEEAPFTGGFFMEPTILADVPSNASIMHEECFGPALPIIRFATLDEAIEHANDSDFGLGSSIWTQDTEKALAAVSRLQAGNTWVNDMAIDHDELPFGGVKQSGFGKERGTEVLFEYVNLKSVIAREGFLAAHIAVGTDAGESHS